MARRFVLAAVLLLLALPAMAQPRILNGFAAGGTADVLLRLLADHAAAEFGARPVVENRTGANGFIAAEMVARGPTDGSVIGLCLMGMMSISPELPGAQLPIDMADFTGVAMIALSPYGLVVSAQGPYRSLEALVAAARARPNAVSYASTGAGSAAHLFGALVGLRTGAELVHVPYRGGAPAVLDLVAARTDFLMISTGDVARQLSDGQLRLLAWGDERRMPGFPEAPTLATVIPGIEASTWFALCGPRGLGAEGRARWERAVRAAIADTGFQARLQTLGLQPHFEDGPTLDRRIAADRARWREVIRAANIRAD
jgi:tripartite-type tricarboxylate transporter receptor subunit TctC